MSRRVPLPAALALVLTLVAFWVVSCASPGAGMRAPAGRTGNPPPPWPLFEPPPGAKIIYQHDFDRGQADDWQGEIVDPEVPKQVLPGSRGALKVGGGREWTSRRIAVPVTEETVLSFYLYTDDSPYLFVQCMNDSIQENCKSHWYLYPNRDYGRWVHVYWPLTGTLVDCATNYKEVTKPGQTLSDVQIHFPKGSSIFLDRIRIYAMDAPAKVKQAVKDLEDARVVMSAGMATKQVLPLRPAAQAVFLNLASGKQASELEARGRALSAKGTEVTWQEGKAFFDEVACLKAVVDRYEKYFDRALRLWAKDIPGQVKTPEYAVGTQHAMERLSDLHWMYPFTGDVTGFHQLHAARNEYESFQAVVLPFSKDLKGVDVRFGDLRQVGGRGVIPAANCTWRTQPYVQLLPTFGYPGTDWVAPKPDPLLPGKPFDLPAHRWAPLWITVYTPPGVPAGDYEGTMTVRAANSHDLPVQIRLHVWDYDIPRTGRFRAQTSFGMGDPAKFYGREVTPEWRRQWYEWMLSYRFSPTEQYGRGFSPHPDDIDFCRQRGNNVWILAGLAWAKKVEDIPLDALRERYEVARQAGILDSCHVYIGDESGDFPLMRAKANLIHANFPGLKVMIGGSVPRRELIGYIDIWDPIMNPGGVYGFDPAAIRAAQDRGEETMWYVAAAPQHPYPNVHMGDPLYAARMIFWLSWKYNITGFEYYCFAIWRPNFNVQPRWPESPWITYSWDHANGDGQLCYPGPGGAPAASVRLEAIRDGIEDWEAMFILQGAAEALQAELDRGSIAKDKASAAQALRKEITAALAIDEAFCKDTTHWALDPDGLQRRRNEISRCIEQAVALVGKDRFEAFQARRLSERKTLEANRLEENRRRAAEELKAAPATTASAPAGE